MVKSGWVIVSFGVFYSLMTVSKSPLRGLVCVNDYVSSGNKCLNLRWICGEVHEGKEVMEGGVGGYLVFFPIWC